MTSVQAESAVTSDTVVGAAGDSWYRQPREFEGRMLRRCYRFPDNSLPAASVIAVELLALVCGGLLAVVLADSGVPIWVAPVVLAVLGVVVTVRFQGTSLAERLLGAVRRSQRVRAATLPTIAADVALPEGHTAAILADGELLATVLEVRGSSEAVRVGGSPHQPAVPLELLAETLIQYDIRLHSIDVMATTGAHGRAAWVTVRYEPGRDFVAVERRGGDDGGATRALITATRRIVQRLQGAGLVTQALDAAAVEALWQDRAPTPPQQWTARGATVSDGARTVTVGDIRRLDRAWVADDAAHTTTMLRLLGHNRAGHPLWAGAMMVASPAHAPAHAAAHAPAHSPAPLPAGACTAPAHAITARAALVPGAPFDPRAFAVHTGSANALAQHSPRLDTPTQLVGFTATGAPVTVNLSGGDIAAVRLNTSAHTMLQVCFRAIEAGAQLSIATHRPQLWEPLLAHFDSPALVNFANSAPVPGSAMRPLITVDDAVSHPRRSHAVCAVAYGSADAQCGPAPYHGEVLDVEEHPDVPGAAVLSYAGQRIAVGLTRRAVEDGVFGHITT